MFYNIKISIVPFTKYDFMVSFSNEKVLYKIGRADKSVNHNHFTKRNKAVEKQVP